MRYPGSLLPVCPNGPRFGRLAPCCYYSTMFWQWIHDVSIESLLLHSMCCEYSRRDSEVYFRRVTSGTAQRRQYTMLHPTYPCRSFQLLTNWGLRTIDDAHLPTHTHDSFALLNKSFLYRPDAPDDSDCSTRPSSRTSSTHGLCVPVSCRFVAYSGVL
jgi:hypothetical protein